MFLKQTGISDKTINCTNCQFVVARCGIHLITVKIAWWNGFPEQLNLLSFARSFSPSYLLLLGLIFVLCGKIDCSFAPCDKDLRDTVLSRGVITYFMQNILRTVTDVPRQTIRRALNTLLPRIIIVLHWLKIMHSQLSFNCMTNIFLSITSCLLVSFVGQHGHVWAEESHSSCGGDGSKSVILG